MPHDNRRHLKLPPAELQVLDYRLRYHPPLILGQCSPEALDRRTGQSERDVEGQVLLDRPLPSSTSGVVLGSFYHQLGDVST